jgi:hypothetical protein
LTTVYSHPAYKEGFQNYKNNKGCYCNPYSIGSNEHNIFERGWTQALKKQPKTIALNRLPVPLGPPKAGNEKKKVVEAMHNHMKRKGD